MATITSAQSGNWGTGATWVGGVAPADNDTVVIAAGHAVLFNVDHTGWANGINGLTITTSAGTPGKLYVDGSLANGTYRLKMKAATTIAASGTAANKGQLWAANDCSSRPTASSTPLPNGIIFILDFTATTSSANGIVATDLDIALVCTEPAVKKVTLTAQALNGATSLTVDVSSVAWPTGASAYISICDPYGAGGAVDCVRNTISSIAGTSIGLGSALSGQKEIGAQVWLVYRNIQVLYGGSSGATGTAVVNTKNPLSATDGAILIALVRKQDGAKAGTGVVQYSGMMTLGGVIDGFTTGINEYQLDSTCVIVGCTNGMTYTGTTYGGKVAGAFIGCSSFGLAAYAGDFYVTAELFGNSTCIFAGHVTLASPAKLIGSYIGLSCSNALVYRGVTIGGASSPNYNTYDVNLPNGSEGYGAGLLSATKLSGYTTTPSPVGSFFYDFADANLNPQPGYLYGCNYGGNTVTDTATIPASPPIPLDYAYKSTFEHATRPHYVDIPIQAQAGVPVRIRFYGKLNASMATPPAVQLVDARYPFGSTDAARLVVDKAMANSTGWQIVDLVYMPTADGNLALRVSGATTGNYLHWAYRRMRPISNRLAV